MTWRRVASRRGPPAVVQPGFCKISLLKQTNRLYVTVHADDAKAAGISARAEIELGGGEHAGYARIVPSRRGSKTLHQPATHSMRMVLAHGWRPSAKPPPGRTTAELHALPDGLVIRLPDWLLPAPAVPGNEGVAT